VGLARRLAKVLDFVFDDKIQKARIAHAFFANPDPQELAAFVRGDIVT
tara:strand:+ start:186409 stop:186552 length:144 start_codon:yes stop_codon:yes gene_type:complete